jgi:prepilin-type N-terminal cleavage/methylation domain-containing protein
MTKNSNLARAFTLLELLIVIAVAAILASIAYPIFIGAQERAKVTKDMNNLRQIGIATQLYMNDNDGALFSTTSSWMTQLYPKYTAAWGIFQSPFDTRSPSEAGTAAPVSPISYGINGTAGLIGMAADKITKPTVFILFAAAQDNSAAVAFQGVATPVAPGVTVLAATSTPPGAAATGGTQNNRTRINALFADLHCETMPWTTFTNTTPSPADPSADLRWTPYLPYP